MCSRRFSLDLLEVAQEGRLCLRTGTDSAASIPAVAAPGATTNICEMIAWRKSLEEGMAARVGRGDEVMRWSVVEESRSYESSVMMVVDSTMESAEDG